MKYYKILKTLPILAMLLFIGLTYILTILYVPVEGGAMNYLYVQIGVILFLALSILPSVFIIFEIFKNNKFREKALDEELKVKGKDERESNLIAKASQKAFASMHLAIWITIVTYLPISLITGGLFYLDIAGINFAPVLTVLVPLAVGNFVFHQNLKEIKSPEINKRKLGSILLGGIIIIFILKLGYDWISTLEKSRSFERVNKKVTEYCTEKNEEALIEAVKKEDFKDVKIEMIDGKKTLHYGYMVNGSWGTTDQPLESYCNNINK